MEPALSRPAKVSRSLVAQPPPARYRRGDMGVCKSTPEIEQGHLQAFGRKLGPIYHALYNEVLWLHAKWLEYRKLYAGSPQRIDLLNATAPFFFYVVQDVLWEDVLLHIARLTDPAEQGTFQNLTLLRLSDAVPDPQLAEETRSLIRTAESRASFARTWRNKRLAHCDLAHVLKPQAMTLPGISRQDVEGVLESFRAVMNKLYRAYLHSEVDFRQVGVGTGDADSLAYNLAEARQVEDRRQQMGREGRFVPEIFKRPSVP